jgi:uncharacterized membrane protein YdjX (TVP38/TMEM64 family)
MSIESFISEIYLFLSDTNQSGLIIFFISVLLLNLFFPASLIILSIALIFDPVQAPFISFASLVISSTIPYLFTQSFDYKLVSFLGESHKARLENVMRYEASRAQFIIRLLSIPFILQNLLSANIANSFAQYISITAITSIPWILLFSFFGSSLREASGIFVLLSASLIILYGIFIKRRFDLA